MAPKVRSGPRLNAMQAEFHISPQAVAMSVGEGVVVGAIVAILGALVGTYAGYHIRHAIVTKANLPDLPVALLEDVIAIAGGLLIVSRV